MLTRFIVLILLLSFVDAPLHAEQLAEVDVPTQVIPAGQKGDKFDRDFADDFDGSFAEAEAINEILIDDPLEKINRGVFWVNDKLYFYLIKPIARGYRLILPRQARVSVANVFNNMATPVRAANDLLQLKFHDMATELYRLIVNSTVGIGGLFDPAASFVGVDNVDDEDFGQTLGYYGAGHGFYLVLPILGPSSLRDGAGTLVDTFSDPIRYADVATLTYFGGKSFKVVNSLSLDRDTYEGIVRDSLDPYLFVRAAYAQRRAAQVGKVNYDILSIDGNFWDEETFNPFKWLGL
ncbi:VacJ family lipoprotein [Malonomonas rubra]|uniref:MlaA family lipoprotein n=1 Tax=Malonomonas rubra TaxID=57040 RepID=UPI0026F11120|nr:VacJ family lipoprotein [Malonomonas rubra]